MESMFQFTNPSLTKVEFGINEGFRNNNDKEVNIKINMTVSINRKEGCNQAYVSLKVELGEKGDLTPYYIIATESANFRWNEDIAEEKVDKLLNQNAPSLLLSYVRPVISQLTGASPFEAFNIPFMNFTNRV